MPWQPLASLTADASWAVPEGMLHPHQHFNLKPPAGHKLCKPYRFHGLQPLGSHSLTCPADS